MGIGILIIVGYLGLLSYWQYWAWVAKRDQRWNRWHYCRKKRNEILCWTGAVAAVALGVYFS